MSAVFQIYRTTYFGEANAYSRDISAFSNSIKVIDIIIRILKFTLFEKAYLLS